MFEWSESLTREQVEAFQVYPEAVDLPELHRLTAQQGQFLHAPGAWDKAFELDRIIFERGKVLTDTERFQLYPPTSKLEEDLQAFAQVNSASEWAEYCERTSPGSFIHLNPPPSEQLASCFHAGISEPAPGWPSDEDT